MLTSETLQIGSALCGAAQNMVWLVVCRAVQGIGGGGIIQMVQITISDIVSLQEYAPIHSGCDVVLIQCHLAEVSMAASLAPLGELLGVSIQPLIARMHTSCLKLHLASSGRCWEGYVYLQPFFNCG